MVLMTFQRRFAAIKNTSSQPDDILFFYVAGLATIGHPVVNKLTLSRDVFLSRLGADWTLPLPRAAPVSCTDALRSESQPDFLSLTPTDLIFPDLFLSLSLCILNNVLLIFFNTMTDVIFVTDFLGRERLSVLKALKGPQPSNALFVLF